VVDVNLLATYSASAGAASYNAATGSCANVSCHGGVATPAWGTGTLDVATQCQACHQPGSALGVPEANSYFSGQHGFHLDNNVATCTDCHDPAKLAAAPPSHFSGLATPGFEQLPGSTLQGNVN
jgi:predicted CxxxxCH...CXXCH cytochrome family protein